MIGMVGGIVLFLLGTSFLRALTLPIGYWAFIIPIFGFLTEHVRWPSQLLSARIGVFLLHLFGYTAFLYDQFIEFLNITLEVAEGCSGINFLLWLLQSCRTDCG